MGGDATAGGRPQGNRLGLLVFWGPLVLWWLAILGSGGDRMSAGHTSRYVEPIVRWFLPHASDVTLAVAHIAVRKAGHLSAYAVVGLLAYRAIRAGRRPAFRTGWAWQAWALGIALAGTDELRQSFVASRSGTFGDVAIDAIGCGAALVALAWVRSRQANRGDRSDV